MKKKFLWMFMVAAAIMTSCSSVDEPAVMNGEGDVLSRAGSRAISVDTEEALREAIDFEEEEISIVGEISLSEDLVLDYPVTIIGTTNSSLTYSGTTTIVCNSDVVLSGLTIIADNNTGVGAVTLNAEDITVTLDGVNLTQNAEGTSDARSTAGIGIKYEAYKNSLVIKNNSVITLPGNKYVRGIDLLPTELTTIKSIEISDSRISIGTDPDFPSTYSRGISFTRIECDSLTISNSTLEGAYYIINVNVESKISVKVVENSTLSGRCGFNIWTDNFTAYVENSTIVGKNNWSGNSETFANVVINTTAANSNMTFINTTFKMDVNKYNGTNKQYAIQYRLSDQTLTLGGTITVIDTDQNEVDAYIYANPGVDDIKNTELTGFEFDSTQANCHTLYNF